MGRGEGRKRHPIPSSTYLRLKRKRKNNKNQKGNSGWFQRKKKQPVSTHSALSSVLSVPFSTWPCDVVWIPNERENVFLFYHFGNAITDQQQPSTKIKIHFFSFVLYLNDFFFFFLKKGIKMKITNEWSNFCKIYFLYHLVCLFFCVFFFIWNIFINSIYFCRVYLLISFSLSSFHFFLFCFLLILFGGGN